MGRTVARAGHVLLFAGAATSALALLVLALAPLGVGLAVLGACLALAD